MFEAQLHEAEAGTASGSQQPERQREENRSKFELELEFVQALANPFYLHSLAHQGFLNQPAFVNYLKYLQYWKAQEYARFILYPHALHHLDLLQNEQFRKDIGKEEWRDSLAQKQFEHWRSWREPSRLDAASNNVSNLVSDGEGAASSANRVDGTIA